MPSSRSRPPDDAPSKPANHQRGERAASAEEVTPNPQPSQPPARAARAAERRQAIIDAALEEFISRGFTATRLDDVARRAGVAKGTIYLHFKDKESMFEELIRTALVPLIGRLHAPPPIGGSVRDAVEGFARTFIAEVASTKRGEIVRLIVAEGPRFPAIADFYYREVVSRGLAADGVKRRFRIGVELPQELGVAVAVAGGIEAVEPAVAAGEDDLFDASQNAAHRR